MARSSPGTTDHFLEALKAEDAMTSREELLAKNAPREYLVDDPAEVRRLMRECRGYLHTCHNKHGTDWEGRKFAIDALEKLADRDVAQTPPPDPIAGAETLHGMIAAIYGGLDVEDCAWVDREWAKMRGYTLPTSGTNALAALPSGSQATGDLTLRQVQDWLNVNVHSYTIHPHASGEGVLGSRAGREAQITITDEMVESGLAAWMICEAGPTRRIVRTILEGALTPASSMKPREGVCQFPKCDCPGAPLNPICVYSTHSSTTQAPPVEPLCECLGGSTHNDVRRRCDLCGLPVSSTEQRPFYGAECPNYPACKGGCGLGCTKEIEAAALSLVSPSTHEGGK